VTLKYKVPKQSEGPSNPSTAVLVAKAFDPIGGVCLKYETNRAVEVGRLMLGYQDLGQLMQNVKPTVRQKVEESVDERNTTAMEVDEPEKVTESVSAVKRPETTAATGQAPQQSGGGKKKKVKR